ncbi:hypothetical protein P7H74_07845 [Enterococcus devriesei]|uniref:hypothetical protein n=1 Tax=Enterococcus TaxID=1350 RepID=UPI001C106992|nr:hypothetical protein [Enterococcus devriesei]MBU5366220.1 hypothetical protein [Enterococcus devriesei]MDT2821665.1 hypothetical protein [Enterococcus devriesei]
MKLSKYLTGSMLIAACLYQTILLSEIPWNQDLAIFEDITQIEGYRVAKIEQNGKNIDVYNKRKHDKLLSIENRLAIMQSQTTTGGNGENHSQLGIQMAKFSGNLVYGERRGNE